MPEVTIEIGGRSFQVACQAGEEAYLRAAARLLDDEAKVLVSQIGRIPESRLLLMAGLMLADKTAGLEDRLREAEGRLSAQEARIADADAGDPRAGEAMQDDRLREAEARIAAQQAELEELRARADPAETAAAAERLEEAEARIAAQEAELEELRTRPVPEAAASAAMPEHVLEMLATLAARAEALADTVEVQASVADETGAAGEDRVHDPAPPAGS